LEVGTLISGHPACGGGEILGVGIRMEIHYPKIRPGLESRVIEILEEIVKEMPPRTATLEISRVPGQPGWPEPYFALIPTNPAAGQITGVVIEEQGVELTIGKGGMRSISAKGGTLFEGMSCEEEFHQVCLAIIQNGFDEYIVCDRHGRFIYAESTVTVSGKAIKFGSGRWFPLPFARRKRESIQYRPYY
jgi:hypothetical protein